MHLARFFKISMQHGKALQNFYALRELISQKFTNKNFVLKEKLLERVVTSARETSVETSEMLLKAWI